MQQGYIRLHGQRRKRRAFTQTSTSTVSPSPELPSAAFTNVPDMGGEGEVRINQAKRGYDVTNDDSGLAWVNPYAPSFSTICIPLMK